MGEESMNNTPSTDVAKEDRRTKFAHSFKRELSMQRSISELWSECAILCFCIGLFATQLSNSYIVYPALYWPGAFLLLANGALLYIYSRVAFGFKTKRKNIDRQEKIVKPPKKHSSSSTRKWRYIVKCCISEIVPISLLGLLVFPMLLLASEFLHFLRISLYSYAWIVYSLLGVYALWAIYDVHHVVRRQYAIYGKYYT